MVSNHNMEYGNIIITYFIIFYIFRFSKASFFKNYTFLEFNVASQIDIFQN